MTRTSIVSALIAAVGLACSPAVPPRTTATDPARLAVATSTPVLPPLSDSELRATDRSPSPTNSRTSLTFGAAGDSTYIVAGTSETYLGIWIDAPSNGARARSPADVAFVIDTSGSMAGAKIAAARAAARELVNNLSDGDIVSILTFSDEAEQRVAPTVLSSATRPMILRTISELTPRGSTNMHDGLRLAENNAASAPNTHPVRRVVMVSDGMANVGPSSPEALGQVAAYGSDRGVQVSSIGVGLDYDEHTLNALAVRSSGRMYHLTEPQELPALVEQEVGLLRNTTATLAQLEVVPAPGVQILGGDHVRLDWGPNGSVRIPLGTMFAGQHRDVLLRVRVTAGTDGEHALASVRLRFNDPSEGNLERLSEVVAHYHATTDPALVERNYHPMTHGIVATREAAQITDQAAQAVQSGHYDVADNHLAAAESKARAVAAAAKDAAQRDRAMAQASQLSTLRAATKKAAAAPAAAAPAQQRARVLEMNRATMQASGF